MLYIIKKPLITEKNSLHAESGTYVFEVDRKSSKIEIKNAIESSFRVKVDSVRTMVCRGRSKKSKHGLTKPKYWKKALVKVKAGEKISLFEGA